ncbi:MAG TPA: crossover junction endodeoxyribonuclease RuvC [bacterium]|jgi:crossover junction endodeoxyribonuclease RuvC|nr:crossover junction endodeoxyribonuclease RuvC [bacterium]
MKLWRSLTGKIYAQAAPKIILGIDPGLARMGYGAIIQKGSQLKVLEYGTITSEAHTDAEKRLVVIFEKLRKILKKVKPDEIAIEELFFARNVKTAISVGQARGVALLACGLSGVPVFEYKPAEVKQAVAGFGAADKEQIQKMVKLLLGLSEVPKPDDTADALAIAITHAQCSGTRLSELVKKLSKSSVNSTFLKR